MQLPSDHIIDLFYQAQSGTLTPAQAERWESWVSENPELAAHLDSLEEPGVLNNLFIERSPDKEEARRVRMLDDILQRLSIEQPRVVPVVHRVHFLRTAWLRYAVAIIIILGAGAYLWNISSTPKPLITQHQPVPAKNDVMPGGNKAILILADGRQIVLDSAANGSLATENGSAVTKQNGEIIYDAGQVNSDAVTYNTMSTPRGGQYQLTLADGTKVWLNAESSITYPTAFTNKTREVTVSGEAYFEVAKNSIKPFIVSFNDTKVEVLGTAFNINAYAEEKTSKTTLTEGSVRVILNHQSLILQLNEQAVAAKQLTVNKSPDVTQVLAWKKGLFNFKGQDFASAMRQIERWYDIQVVYDQGIPEQQFWGKVYRNLTLLQLLKGLEGSVGHFKLEGKILHVLP